MSAVSIVVPAYAGVDLLVRHLPAAFRELAAYPPGGEVLVVDDASPEPLQAALERSLPGVRVVTRTTNGGFAAAATDGMRAASHELVFLMNSDVRVHAGFLAPLVRELEASDVFAATPCVRLAGQATRIESFVALERSEGRVTLHQPGLDNSHALPTEPADVDFALGGAMLVQRARFEQLGGFDPSYAPFYLEDADLGRRARSAGWRTRYVPSAVVDHFHRGTIGVHVDAHCVRAAIERNRWALTRADDQAEGRREWLSASLQALVVAARSGALRDEATWLALRSSDPSS